MKKTILLLSCIVLLAACEKKEGCTDPDAVNYDEEVKLKNDNGSCLYRMCDDPKSSTYDELTSVNVRNCIYRSDLRMWISQETLDSLVDKDYKIVYALGASFTRYSGDSLVSANTHLSMVHVVYMSGEGPFELPVCDEITMSNGGMEIGVLHSGDNPTTRNIIFYASKDDVPNGSRRITETNDNGQETVLHEPDDVLMTLTQTFEVNECYSGQLYMK